MAPRPGRSILTGYPAQDIFVQLRQPPGIRRCGTAPPLHISERTCAIHLRIRAIDPVARIVESAGTVVYCATRMSERLTRHCRRCLTILIASAFTFATASTHLLSQSERDSRGAQVAVGADHVHLSATVLPFRNGLNRIDLLGTGQSGEIIVSRRGNGNAHGHSIVMFQVL